MSSSRPPGPAAAWPRPLSSAPPPRASCYRPPLASVSRGRSHTFLCDTWKLRAQHRKLRASTHREGVLLDLWGHALTPRTPCGFDPRKHEEEPATVSYDSLWVRSWSRTQPTEPPVDPRVNVEISGGDVQMRSSSRSRGLRSTERPQSVHRTERLHLNATDMSVVTENESDVRV
ncbi:unnamed protein product [Pleuronectes platessa]|uniref:Uncharacterized protein n=1 Tax=Pleuronectes platessa TaxID=8262 RepID=A0A9N7TI79_PLEPL|nr:unnamed protein product [Pleuronectes platessa]